MGRILVTGGTGYIGSHTVVELLENNYQVSIVDDLSNSKVEVVQDIQEITGKSVQFYQIDLTNADALGDYFSKNKVDAVIHFAASKAVGESVEKPLHYYKNNLLGLINLVECMEKHDVGSLIFSSSCTVYGQPELLPVTETSPILPAESPYGNTKQVGEEMIRDNVAVSSQMNAISLRYFNPIGAHHSAQIGELPQGIPNNLLPYLLKVVAGNLAELSVFGDDYNTPDGTCIRDYIHVVDLAKAHVIALQRLLSGQNKLPYEIFNLGTGQGYSVLEVINTFEKVTGQKVPYKVVSRRDGDIEKIYADTSYTNEELGWRAQLGLDEMLLSAWKWQQELDEDGG